MSLIGKAIDKLLEVNPGASSNREDENRRKVDDRRVLCDIEKYKTGAPRQEDDRRRQPERRKRWKRVSKWCSEKDKTGYLEGYHVK